MLGIHYRAPAGLSMRSADIPGLRPGLSYLRPCGAEVLPVQSSAPQETPRAHRPSADSDRHDQLAKELLALESRLQPAPPRPPKNGPPAPRVRTTVLKCTHPVGTFKRSSQRFLNFFGPRTSLLTRGRVRVF